jgi:SAM-dependent methyltransferase
MSHRIIDLQNWLRSPAGQYLLEWERKQLDEVVVDIFGYHALQMGLPALDALQSNRMPHRWLAMHEEPDPKQPVALRAHVCFDFAALPFPANSLDLVVLPHTLEWTSDPQTTLREVERVLVPEGKVVICSLNPASLWGLCHQRSRLYRFMDVLSSFLPEDSCLISYWRLRDWLRLLGFEVEVGRFGCYRPAVQSLQWLGRWHWLDRLGARFWPIFGAAYFVVAVKRVRGMRLLGPHWKAVPALAAKPVSIAHKR